MGKEEYSGQSKSQRLAARAWDLEIEARNAKTPEQEKMLRSMSKAVGKSSDARREMKQ